MLYNCTKLLLNNLLFVLDINNVWPIEKAKMKVFIDAEH